MTVAVTHDRLVPFGTEVKCDPNSGLTESDKGELRRIYALEGLILIRGLSLSMDQQLDLCSVFGPVLRNSRENYIISNVHKDGLLGSQELRFHNDTAFVPAPYQGASLHALDVSNGVSATRFTSGFRTYERLPEKLRQRIEGRNALFVRTRVDDRRNRLTDLRPGDICSVHPVVGRQKGTGRPYLFVNSKTTGIIIGLSESESDELIEELFSYLYQEDEIYDHQWRQGDIVIWDNLALQHARREIQGGTRTLQRVTIAELSYWDQFPTNLARFATLRNDAPAGAGRPDAAAMS
jgi:taurine dioxygenase